MQIITFTMKEQYYAFETDVVDEIIKMTNYIHIPQAPHWVEGLINLRGDVVTLVNLAKLLDLSEEIVYDNIIIIKNQDRKLAILVQRIDGVMDVEKAAIQQLSAGKDLKVAGLIPLADKIVNLLQSTTIFLENEG